MENNWKYVADKVFEESFTSETDFDAKDDIQEYAFKLMNLIFEATKKECADKAKIIQYSLYAREIDKESILTINKPIL